MPGSLIFKLAMRANPWVFVDKIPFALTLKGNINLLEDT